MSNAASSVFVIYRYAAECSLFIFIVPRKETKGKDYCLNFTELKIYKKRDNHYN